MKKVRLNSNLIIVILAALLIGVLELVAGRYISKSVVHDSKIGTNQVQGYGCLSYADIFCFDHRYGWIRRKDINFDHQNEDYFISHRWAALEPNSPIVHVSDSKMGALEVNDRQSTVANLTRITGVKNENLGHSGYNLLQYYIWVNDLLKVHNLENIKTVVIHVDFYSDITLLEPDVWYCYSPFAWQLYPRFNPARDTGQELEAISLPISGARITNYYSDRLVIPSELKRYLGSSDLNNKSYQFLLDYSNLYRLYKRGVTSNNKQTYARCEDRNIRQGGSALHEIFDPKMKDPQYWNITRKIISEISKISAVSGKRILFVVHPDPFFHHNYSEKRFKGLPQFADQSIRESYSTFFKILEDAKIDYIDLRKTFQDVKERHMRVSDERYKVFVDQGLYFYKHDTSHMNPYGHVLVSCAIAKKIGVYANGEARQVCESFLERRFINDFLAKSETDQIFFGAGKYKGGSVLLGNELR